MHLWYKSQWPWMTLNDHYAPPQKSEWKPLLVSYTTHDVCHIHLHGCLSLFVFVFQNPSTCSLIPLPPLESQSEVKKKFMCAYKDCLRRYTTLHHLKVGVSLWLQVAISSIVYLCILHCSIVASGCTPWWYAVQALTATNHDDHTHHGHKQWILLPQGIPWWPQPLRNCQIRGEFTVMLSSENKFSWSYVFGRHGLWQSWFVAVMVLVCGHHGHGLWPSWFVVIMVCGHHGLGLWPPWFVAIMVMVCGRLGLWPSWSWFVAVMVCGRHGLWLSWFVVVMVVAVILNPALTRWDGVSGYENCIYVCVCVS